MYLHKQDVNNLRIPPKQTRGAARDQFYVEKYNVCKYKNLPVYKGAELWKLLPHDIAASDSIYQLKSMLKSTYRDSAIQQPKYCDIACNICMKILPKDYCMDPLFQCYAILSILCYNISYFIII